MQRLDRRLRVFFVAGDARKNGNGEEQRRQGTSWGNSDSSVNALSGWSGNDSSDNSGNPQLKRWFEGIVKIGVAGVLITGLTFATLSISKRNTSRPKQQMEPLKTAQEELLNSDDKNDVTEETQNEGGNIMQDESGQLTTSGADTFSSPEVGQYTTEKRPSHEKVEEPSSYNEAANKFSMKEDLQSESALDDMSLAPESQIVNGSSATSSIKDLNEESLAHDDSINLRGTNSSLNDVDDPLIINTDHQEGMSRSSEMETSNLSLDEVDDISTEPLPEEDLEILIPIPTTEELDVTIPQQVSNEQNRISNHNVDDSEPSETTSMSEFAYPVEQNEKGYNNDINEERTFSKPTKSENSFYSAGIPAPSVVSAALQVPPGKVLVPAFVDQVQGQALVALQTLKVIEADVRPSDLCTRREYARWLVSASSALSRSTVSKVYPAMYIENVTELAFDDITPEDRDFSSIQGLAEAGLISSKLSRQDLLSAIDHEPNSPFCFSPESPLSRQDLVCWKMALERRHLPEADRKALYEISGFIDIDKIHPDAWPALMADLYAGEQGITALAFGYTKLFQPDKPVTKSQAAIALSTGEASDIVSEELTRIEAEAIAENIVAAHNDLVSQVEKEINESFEKDLLIEREKVNAVEKLAEEARIELERLRTEREEENKALLKERAAIESETEIVSRLRREVEEQLESLMSNKVEMSYEKERFNKLRVEAESEKQTISRLQYELEVERKALSMARAWAEDEAKRAREQAKSLEEARDRWQKHGIKVVVDDDLREDASAGVTWLDAGKQFSVEETVNRGESLVGKLKVMGENIRGKSKVVINKIIQVILSFNSVLREWACRAGRRAQELKDTAASKLGGSVQGLQQNTAEFRVAVKEGAKRVVGDCREGVEKLTQKFKT